jgi:biotin carboxyl carrier protein
MGSGKGRRQNQAATTLEDDCKMARQEIRAEISGTVVSVLVKVGGTVAEGDEVAIIEVMKMEIPVIAPCSGKVTEVRIAEGNAVAENDLGFVLEA